MTRVLAALLLVSAAAAAQSEPGPSRPRESVPVNGVDEAPRRGAYVETTLGLFSTMGGTARFSSVQPYLGVSVGHEIGTHASVFAALGLGASNASCFTGTDKLGNCDAADSFGATFVELGASLGKQIAARTLLSFKLVGGLTDLSPGPVRNDATVPDHLFGFHGGAGVAIDYDTHLDHFAVGMDALLRYTFARYTPAGQSQQTLGLPSFALMPRIRYVF